MIVDFKYSSLNLLETQNECHKDTLVIIYMVFFKAAMYTRYIGNAVSKYIIKKETQ